MYFTIVYNLNVSKNLNILQNCNDLSMCTDKNLVFSLKNRKCNVEDKKKYFFKR